MVPNNCTEIKDMFHHRVLSQDLHDRMQQSIHVSMTAGFLSDTSNNMYDNLQYLTSDIHHLECQYKLLLLTILFFVVAQQHPSSALSKLTGKVKAALTSRDVLKKYIVIQFQEQHGKSGKALDWCIFK